MCHSRNITYTCHHTLTFRLSTCRGTFTTAAHPKRSWSTARRAACHDSPAVALRSSQPCGECQSAAIGAKYAQLQADLQKAALESPSAWKDYPSAEYREAELELVEQCCRDVRAFPGLWVKLARLKRDARRAPGARTVGCSPLRRELRPEDLPGRLGCTAWGWNDDWESGHKTMAEEVEEREAEEAEESRAYEALCATETLAWEEELPTPDQACDVEGVEGVAEGEAVLEPSLTTSAVAEMTTTTTDLEPEEKAKIAHILELYLSPKEGLAATESSPSWGIVPYDCEEAERELAKAVLEPTSNTTVTAEVTTIIPETEQVALNTENANPSFLRAPEPRRQPTAPRSKSRSKCDRDANESRWVCLPSWLMVGS
ncbi:hypothetical protein B0A54_14099 [Friedmanniomyces endolithicus]|uniref:Uncharacterized protein n=1 Tax=Friedmanniomyces endolithicus TaxID=329885 RepID=A0A4U0UEW2_9PEZI|nr:hypothetical protein B0A54_14099 [Friedmanniomyces endolithicus]